MVNEMRASVTPLSELTAAETGAWAELYEHAIEPNPYFAPDFVRSAARGLGRDDVGLLVAGDWEACLPVVRERSWRRVPLPALSTWLHSYCLLGTPLAVSAAAARALVAGGRADRGAAFLALEWLGTGGPVA